MSLVTRCIVALFVGATASRLRKSSGLQADTATARGESHSAPKNVMGNDIQSCSEPGTALTGFTRTGSCVDIDDDNGSHHICIKMESDFCKVTGQIPDWCSEEMPCMGQSGDCAIGNWCVCQWAFADYIQEAGGCDAITDVVCDSTNMVAMRAYEESSEPDHQAALACLKQKCNL
mmetsp:Transcript_97994/g.277152  ORF Transcript_97994/g.277152 Transcript_97994/m.277152 type:complete len:175 (-) Transcript_97994:30-554(-)